MPDMGFKDIIRVLEEIHRTCASIFTCSECHFSDKDGYCNLTGHPESWDLNDCKEEDNATD